jgi:hypothetical protein
VTAEHLKRGDACDEAVRAFSKAFPNGGTWPDDIDKAVAAGLDVDWCRKLGLLRPIADPAHPTTEKGEPGPTTPKEET